MKINQWTLGLAAVGVVSLASAVNAEEAKMNALQTALSSTTISGYVDTSVNWNDIDDNGALGVPFSGDKSDGFNLNVVKLSIEKPLDESEWAAGYKVDLLFGPDAVNYNSSFNAVGGGSAQHFAGENGADFCIKQAYVALRTPVGNGIDWKIGVYDTIIGYETFESGNNPNFTRSWGYAVEPTQHTGILGTYRVNDMIALAAGVANVETAGINAKDDNSWDKAWMGSIAVTAPEDMGFLSGSTLYAGAVLGSSLDQDNYYIGATFNTPVTGLKAGVAYDYVCNLAGGGGDASIFAGYLSFQATEKLSLHGRGEYSSFEDNVATAVTGAGVDGHDVISLTGTLQYDLWKNVVSRLETRYDSVRSTHDDAIGLYANFIYKF